MDLMDLALKYKDYEWVKELAKQMDQPESVEKDFSENTSVGVYNKEDVALEDILNSYGVKENAGIRSFNIHSEFDRNNSDLVFIEKPSYKKGETVKYRVPTANELIFIRGTVSGYVMGYGDAQKTINQQMMQFYNSVTTQSKKTQNSSQVRQKKAQKKKEVS